MPLPQGDLGLLETDVAQRPLASAIPARLAWTARDDEPRVAPIWLHSTGEEVVMASLPGAATVPALRARPDAAITIDTEGFPAEVHRIAVRPAWVAVLDSQTRFPAVLGGVRA